MRRTVYTSLVAAAVLLAPCADAVADGDIESNIERHCAAAWPDSFQMQEFCQQQQRGGARDVKAFLDRHGLAGDLSEKHKEGNPHARMLYQCVGMWGTGDTQDYMMISFCLEQEEAAFKRMQGGSQ